jgi:hypothetical protein
VKAAASIGTTATPGASTPTMWTMTPTTSGTWACTSLRIAAVAWDGSKIRVSGAMPGLYHPDAIPLNR